MSDTNTGEQRDQVLFWGCFISLIATAFLFIVRALTIDDWGAEFELTDTMKGEISGAGLWPFAITIVLFSLVVDKIGYGRAMAFAFACHLGSALMLVFAQSPNMLYWGFFIGALGNGTVEAVINPVVATMYSKEKTKWLNILHAGWPGGLVIAGVITILLVPNLDWRMKMALVLIPTLVYGAILVTRKFPVNERVLAGVSYKDMLAQLGAGGAFLIVLLMGSEISRVVEGYIQSSNPDFVMSRWVPIIAAVIVAAGYYAYVRSIGQPIMLLLLIVMLPLATTELGVDSWITSLMESSMADLGINAGWVLVYTSFIMMVLRFNAGPIVSRISPLGLLAVSSVLAILGLYALSAATGAMILVAATLYGFGKTFFWPTTLGVVAERFPKGGALTLNTIAGVGMIGVGIIGVPILGNMSDSQVKEMIVEYDQAEGTTLEEQLITKQQWLLGSYEAVDTNTLQKETSEEVQDTVYGFIHDARKSTLARVTVFPGFMLLCYIGLILYFRSKGGYEVVHLDHEEPEKAHPAPEEY